MGTMTFWDRIPRIGPILQRTPQEHFHRTKTRFKGAFDFGDRTGFWDRIPRIGPILQRTPQEHFHRTKTRFKAAFDFWGQTGSLFLLLVLWGVSLSSTMGTMTFWDRIPRIGPILSTPQEHFHRTKTRFKGAFDFGDRTGFWDRIPRIGPILQRTPQEHFHRTKTRFKGFGDTGPWLFILITSTMGSITF